MNGKDLEIVAGAPAEFTDSELGSFLDLVRAGGEVADQVLESNIENAKALVFLRQKGQARGIAALKHPLLIYRKRISKIANAEISEVNFPYELGYIFIVPEARGKKLSSRLIAKSLELVPGSGVFGRCAPKITQCALLF